MLKLTLKISNLPLLFLLLLNSNVYAQNGFQPKELRLKSTNSLVVDTTVNIVIFKTDSSLRKGTLVVLPNKTKAFGFKQEPIFPDTTKFKVGDLKDSANVFPFRFSISRDSIDDRIISFDVFALDSSGTRKNLKNTSLTVYIKPVSNPIASNEEFESWFFAGTNFDLFNGIKPQEFFFRSNSFLRICNKVYLQFAFYKNRYFVNDSTSNRFVWQNNTPILIRDSMYVYTKGNYFHKRTQTNDPLGFQLDVLYKVGSRSSQNSTTSFFVSGGFDVSSTTVTIENTFSKYDTIMFRTRNPDSTIKGQIFPFPPEKLQYRTGVGNLNIGLMCIYDDTKSNFKGQINAGVSVFYQLLTLYTKGGTPTFGATKQIYFQIRTFYTYKPLGISFGFDTYKTSSELLKLNATLSKVVDIETFFKTFSPINSLSIK